MIKTSIFSIAFIVMLVSIVSSAELSPNYELPLQSESDTSHMFGAAPPWRHYYADGVWRSYRIIRDCSRSDSIDACSDRLETLQDLITNQITIPPVDKQWKIQNQDLSFEWSPSSGTNLYVATITNVVDGDTVDIELLLWPKPRHTLEVRVRIPGIDTPEIRGKCASERVKAKEALAFLEKYKSKNVVFYAVHNDKFGGRLDIDLFTEHFEQISQLMIKSGHARAYDGKGARLGWC